MKIVYKLSVVAGLFLFWGVGLNAFAEETKPKEKNANVEEKIEVLADEIEKLKAGQELFPPLKEGKFGLAPAASKVYHTKKGVSIGGYGEMLFESFSDKDESGAASGKKNQIDFLRGVFYVGYKFTDRFIFNSEIEFEHAATDRAGSVSLEFAYLDFLWKDPLNFRAGLLLVPMGFVNELHEPPIFLGTERPLAESQIIPSTWRENGVGFFGNYKGFSYRGYLLNGFDGVGGGSSNATGFSASGLRNGRQKGSKAVTEDVAFVGRADYEGVPGLLVGASGYIGKAGQNNLTTGGAGISALTTMVEGHADFRYRGAEFRGLLAYAHVDQADRINDAKALTGNQSVGEDLLGMYIQLGYDVFSLLSTEQKLIPFFRYEWLDTQLDVPAGFSSNPANEQEVYMFGVSYKPILNVVVKADYQIRQTQANTGVDQFNLALGYLF